MRRLLHLLLIAAVTLCGLHFAEPVQAHDSRHHIRASADDAHATQDSGHEERSGPSHDSLHHCPITPDLAMGAVACSAFENAALHFAAAAVPLHSLSRAPPVDPPAS